MTFALSPGKLGFKLGEVLVGLQSGTEDTPETISSTQNKLHSLGYVWNPDTLAYEVLTKTSAGLSVVIAGGTVAAPDEATRIDVASTTVTYIGKAEVGAAPDAATWKIMRLTSTTEGDLTIEYADGDAGYDNVWDDRASLTYS
jgi:hypothetical protein